VRLIIWQRLVPTKEGGRTPLREFLVFDDTIRDILLESPVEQVTATTRKLLKQHGQPLLIDAERKFKEGLIEERLFHYLQLSEQNADKDAGL
jgi:defect-in-organelle-trafficking protein DotB